MLLRRRGIGAVGPEGTLDRCLFRGDAEGVLLSFDLTQLTVFVLKCWLLKAQSFWSVLSGDKDLTEVASLSACRRSLLKISPFNSSSSLASRISLCKGSLSETRPGLRSIESGGMSFSSIG